MGSITQTVERELKLSAARDFRLPDLPGEPLAPRVFTSTYVDTGDLRLAGSGVTLRRRVEGGTGVWQLKLPHGGDRLELEQAGGSASPPPGLLDLVTAYHRGRRLEAVARLRTRRTGIRVHELTGPVADVTVDAVAVLDGRRTARAFQELEVELLDGDRAVLDRLEAVLRGAGAGPGDTRPKLFQALELEPATVEPAPPRSAPASERLRWLLGVQYRAVLRHDPGTRLGTDPEELHQLRVATRRTRAFLRAGLPLLDADWAEALRAELGWLGAVLGPVRDLDVLGERLRADADGLPGDEQRALRRYLALLAAERQEHRGRLLEAMRSDRYLELLARLELAAAEPHLSGMEVPLAELAERELRRLRRAVRALPADPPDEALHAIRIRGKRARYAAELAEPAAGRRATRFIAAAKAFQDVLGEHQDSVVAGERLREGVRRVGGKAFAFVAGRLVEREEARHSAARAAFPEAWQRLERSGRDAWR
ncbi:MAG: CHAD domain-containing protein [Thermoleophilia bacterium]|nr:CHAD domain-containing protein [Thermoleophilia bacterium]